MCLTLTGRVVTVRDEVATIVAGGRRIPASLVLVPETAPGDWVTVGAGWVLARLTPDEAAIQLSYQETLDETVAGEIGGPNDAD